MQTMQALSTNLDTSELVSGGKMLLIFSAISVSKLVDRAMYALSDLYHQAEGQVKGLSLF
jgi:hypothetical protein